MPQAALREDPATPPDPERPGIMSPEEFRRELGVSRETLGRLERYAALLKTWNPRINLVAHASLQDLWRRHMLDSAQLLPLLPPRRRRRVIVDLGSGAGFPGLVLAILGAGEVHLVESDQRKAVFLREAARHTDTEATVHPVRIDALGPLTADVVTARALAPLSDLIAYAVPLLGPGGVALFLKGQRAAEEVAAARKHWNFVVEPVISRSDPSGSILQVGVTGRADDCS